MHMTETDRRKGVMKTSLTVRFVDAVCDFALDGVLPSTRAPLTQVCKRNGWAGWWLAGCF